MKTVRIETDDLIYEFYQKAGRQAGLPVEKVMSDALFKLSGELSLSAINKKRGSFLDCECMFHQSPGAKRSFADKVLFRFRRSGPFSFKKKEQTGNKPP